jgi:hypothetical protein
MADVNGEIYTTSGIPYQNNWDTWTSVPQGSGTPVALPGATVAVVPPIYDQRFRLYIADRLGEIRKTSSADPPATPENVRVTSVTAQTIDISWNESNPASVELDGFVSYLTWTGGGSNIKLHGPADRTASFTGLQSGIEYKFKILAYNANGYSPISAPVVVTTPIATGTVIVNLDRQQAGPTYAPYAGQYPPFGSVPAGHVNQIRVPSPGLVPRVGFVKKSHTTEECGDPNAVVIIDAGQTTTAAQMTAIFGVARPPFSTTSPIGFVACVDGGNLPGFIQIELTIVSDG